MDKIYISGKITGTDDYTERFYNTHFKLSALHPNSKIINPIEVCSHLPEGSDWHVYMMNCILALAECDTIYMMKCWKDSKGAKVEHELAQKMRLKIIYE